MSSLDLLKREGVNEESIGLSFLASLTGKSRMAAAGFVHVVRGRKYREGACLLKASVPTILDVHTSFM